MIATYTEIAAVVAVFPDVFVFVGDVVVADVVYPRSTDMSSFTLELLEPSKLDNFSEL